MRQAETDCNMRPVFTHSDDATVNKKPPGKDKGTKDWDINYDERDMNEGEFRG
jgi:hypothetical protein